MLAPLSHTPTRKYLVNGGEVEFGEKVSLDVIAKGNLSQLDRIFMPREERENDRSKDAVILVYKSRGNVEFSIFGIFLNPLGQVCFSNWPSEDELTEIKTIGVGELQVTQIPKLESHLEDGLREIDGSCQNLVPSMMIWQKEIISKEIPEHFLPLFLPTPYLLEQLGISYLRNQD